MSENSPVYRKNFVFGKDHYFIQQPDEWATSLIQLGVEHRIADGAIDAESAVIFRVQDVPDLMDQLADFIVMPRYTDLLDKVTKLQELVDRAEANPRTPNGQVYFDGFGNGFEAGITAIKQILKGD